MNERHLIYLIFFIVVGLVRADSPFNVNKLSKEFAMYLQENVGEFNITNFTIVQEPFGKLRVNNISLKVDDRSIDDIKIVFNDRGVEYHIEAMHVTYYGNSKIVFKYKNEKHVIKFNIVIKDIEIYGSVKLSIEPTLSIYPENTSVVISPKNVDLELNNHPLLKLISMDKIKDNIVNQLHPPINATIPLAILNLNKYLMYLLNTG